MSLKLEEIKKMLDTLGHLEKKGKKKVSDIDDIVYRANIFYTTPIGKMKR